ncbi:ATP-binding protein [Ruminococcus flavefaciens]|uniref:ATP-binding protein n=1 Tax=Ruminococcus flavefaciens TaxID=1265 RepID=UPI0026F22A16|nr:ATP-binding protein [Ruminococcus flavefaciens]MDD7515097.1 ATP-binding protein [Ruminococcus flavefaciens]MDY5692647.1 ATP-binding protein [Ruminococcus flavefaciens]
MFKKAHDKMFRKAQLRLFTMIVSILLAVFIALIGSINVITKAVMRGQSKQVLMQIASGIEYDERESKFRYTPPPSMENKAEKKEPKEPKPTETTAAPPPTTEKETTAGTQAATEKEKVTDAPTEADTQADTQAEEVQTDVQQEVTPETQTQQETDPPETQAPATQPDTDASSGATQWGDPNSGGDWWNWNNGQWNGDWNNGQWNGDWNNGQWNGDWNNGQWNGDWNNGQIPNNGQWGGDWNNGQIPNNGQWNGDWGTGQWNSGFNGQWGIPWGVWPYMWSYEPFQNYFNEPIERNDHGERDPRYDGEEETSDEAAEVSTEDPLVNTAYSDDAQSYIRPLADRTDAVGMADVNREQQNAPNSIRTVSKEDPIPRTLGSIDFFIIMADNDGKYLAMRNNDDMDKEKAQSYINAILNKDTDTGMQDSYQYYQADKPNGHLMVLTDKSYEMDMLKQLKRTTILIGTIALIILSILAYFLSKKSIQPIKTAFNKQKQFVSDASHELKTPLTVISANADVLEGEIGDNKWLKYIKAQTDRMSILVNDLLNLTRLENNNSDLERRYFNLSKAVVNTALPFECQAFESNKRFEVNVDDDVMLCGSEKHIKQMTAIFIDNALKYSNDGGTVRVTLKKMGDRKLFSVYNTGDGIKEDETEKIFERFYRSDQSRNRATGGYGLGLAIAKSIIDKHKFKVHVMNQPGKSVCFVITM